MVNDIVTSKFFNTMQDMTPSPYPGPNNVNDYDAGLRIRWVHGSWLMLSGSANGSAVTSWQNGPARQVNSSASWLARIDPSTLAVVSQDFVGLPQVSPNTAPSDKNGLYGIDANVPGQGNHPFYLLQNRLDRRGWYMTHFDNLPVQLSVPATGDNSFYYNDVTLDQRMSVLHIQGYGVNGTANPANRVTLVGALDNTPWLSPHHVAYGTYAFESHYLTTTGTSTTWINNAPVAHYQGTSSYAPLQVDEPYWFSSDLEVWCHPDISAQTFIRDPINTVAYPTESIGTVNPYMGPSSSYVPSVRVSDVDGGSGGTFGSGSCASNYPLFLYENHVATTNLEQKPIQQMESDVNNETILGYSGLAEISSRITDCLLYHGST